MKFVDNGVPQDFARLTFEGMKVPLCELSEEEYEALVRLMSGNPYTVAEIIAEN